MTKKRKNKRYQQIYDAVVKDSIVVLKDKALDFLGFEEGVVISEVLATESKEIQVRSEFADLCFKTNRGFGLHIEEEVHISRADLYRFAGYNANLSRVHGIDFETVVLTFGPGGVSQVGGASLRFAPVVVNLGDRDADALLERLRGALDAGEGINELELIFLPVCHSACKSVARLLSDGLMLAARLPDAEKVAALMLVLSDRLVEPEELDRLWEEFKRMVKLKILDVAEKKGMERGMEKMQEKIANAMLLKNMHPDTVHEMTGLSMQRIQELQAQIKQD